MSLEHNRLLQNKLKNRGLRLNSRQRKKNLDNFKSNKNVSYNFKRNSGGNKKLISWLRLKDKKKKLKHS